MVQVSMGQDDVGDSLTAKRQGLPVQSASLAFALVQPQSTSVRRPSFWSRNLLPVTVPAAPRNVGVATMSSPDLLVRLGWVRAQLCWFIAGTESRWRMPSLACPFDGEAMGPWAMATGH